MKPTPTLYILLILLVSACAAPQKKRITVLYTADEHGWFAESGPIKGAATMLKQWKDLENYSEADSFLVLSGGDMWTGASASTWSHGKAMVEVMNAMGYDAVALGNHEFDFGIDTLMAHSQRSTFPFLACNIVDLDGEIPSYISPYVLIDANDLRVGLIGLANLETATIASPTAVEDLQFLPYDESVNKAFAQIKKEGADMVIIVGHLCEQEMEALAPLAKELGITLITGGHCHRQVTSMKDEVLLIETAPYFNSYIKVVIEHDPVSKTNTILSYKAVVNSRCKKDKAMNRLVSHWEEKANKELALPIAYTEDIIRRGTPEMKRITCDAWLDYKADADVAIVNAGGIRQDIQAGDITMGDVIGLLPFNNQIVEMSLTGAQLQAFLNTHNAMREDYIISGIDQLEIVPQDTYKVLTSNFLYELAETQFKTYDTQAEYTGISYKEPTIQYLSSKAFRKNSVVGSCPK